MWRAVRWGCQIFDQSLVYGSSFLRFSPLIYSFILFNSAGRIVEGSEDGGSSWHLLDEQTNQIFDNRFQRRSFFVTKTGLLSNTFR